MKHKHKQKHTHKYTKAYTVIHTNTLTHTYSHTQKTNKKKTNWQPDTNTQIQTIKNIEIKFTLTHICIETESLPHIQINTHTHLHTYTVRHTHTSKLIYEVRYIIKKRLW